MWRLVRLLFTRQTGTPVNPETPVPPISNFFPIDTEKHYTYDQIHPIYHDKYDG